MLPVKGSSETELFMHLSNLVFGVHNFEDTKAMRVILFFETFKISAGLQKAAKNCETLLVSEITASDLVWFLT